MVKHLGVIMLVGFLGGCAHHAPTWQERLITPQTAQCYEHIKHWNCATLVQTDLRVRQQFVETNQRILEGGRLYPGEVPDAQLIEVGNSLIHVIDEDLDKLKDLPECWVTP